MRGAVGDFALEFNLAQLDFELSVGAPYFCKFRPDPGSDFLNVSLCSYVPGATPLS